MPSKEHYLRATEELASGSIDRALWAQAVSNAMGVTNKDSAIYVQLRAEELARLERSQNSAQLVSALSDRMKDATRQSGRLVAILALALAAVLVLSAAWKEGARYIELKQLRSQLADAKQEREELLASEDCKNETASSGDRYGKYCLINLNFKIIRLEGKIEQIEFY